MIIGIRFKAAFTKPFVKILPIHQPAAKATVPQNSQRPGAIDVAVAAAEMFRRAAVALPRGRTANTG